MLLVCTFYTPHVHNLAFLRTQAERIDRRLTYVWPMDTRKERAMFEKLKDAYVKARYSKHYRISAEELAWLGACVEELGRVVQEVCLERIQMLESSAAPRSQAGFGTCSLLCTGRSSGSSTRLSKAGSSARNLAVSTYFPAADRRLLAVALLQISASLRSSARLGEALSVCPDPSAINRQRLARRGLRGFQATAHQGAGKLRPSGDLFADHAFQLAFRGGSADHQPPRAERDDHAGVGPQAGSVEHQAGPVRSRISASYSIPLIGGSVAERAMLPPVNDTYAVAIRGCDALWPPLRDRISRTVSVETPSSPASTETKMPPPLMRPS